MCGRFIEMSGVEWVRTDQSVWAEGDYTCYRKFKDIRGDSGAVVTTPYSTFAGDRLPLGRVSIRGVLMYGNGVKGGKMFMVKIRDLNDVTY